MNKVLMQGRLTNDPDLRTTNGGKNVVEFSIAVQRTDTETDFFKCQAWEGTADFIVKHFKKGDGIILSDASLRQEKWENNEGQNRETVRIVVRSANFPLGRNSGERTPTPNVDLAAAKSVAPITASQALKGGNKSGAPKAVALDEGAQKLMDELMNI